MRRFDDIEACPPGGGFCHFCLSVCAQTRFCLGCHAYVCERCDVTDSLVVTVHEPEAHFPSEWDDGGPRSEDPSPT